MLTFMKLPKESSLKGPPISQESRSLPSHLSEISSQPAEAGQILGIRWESVIKDMTYWPPKTAYQQGLPLQTIREMFQ